MSQVDNTAQPLTVESAADLIEQRMTETEVNEEETTLETQEEVDSSNDLEEATEESEEESLEESTDSETNESDEAEPEAEEESTDYQTVDDLAQALEMPLEDFMANIKGKVKINGQEQEVTLSDLKNGYQMEADYRRKTAELAEQRKAFEAESQSKQQEIESRLTNLQSISDSAEQSLLAEYNEVNWKELEDSDPTEYLIQKQKYSEAYNRLQQTKQQAIEEAQRLSQEQEVKNQEAYQETLNREYGLMLEQNPEWQDEAVFKKDQAEIQTYLQDKGFNETEINQLVDHRIVNILRDALKARTDISKVEIAKKKVKKLPKVLKAGSKQTRQDVASKKKSDAVKRLRKTGSREDLQAALLERFN